MITSNILYQTKNIEIVPIDIYDLTGGAVVIYNNYAEILNGSNSAYRYSLSSTKLVVGASSSSGYIYLLIKEGDLLYLVSHKNNAIVTKRIELPASSVVVRSFNYLKDLCMIRNKNNQIIFFNPITSKISSVVNIKTSLKLLTSSYEVNGHIYIPIANSYNMIDIYGLERYKILEIESDSIFDEVSSIYLGGNVKTVKEDRGVASIFFNKNNILLVDIISNNGYDIGYIFTRNQ